MERGKFITFEGGEGTGKTTQVRMLVAALTANGIEAVSTREPGGSVGGERIRELIMERKWGARTEALLFNAARNDHINTMIKPALDKGIWVVCDRYADSTVAYQGYGRQSSDIAGLWMLHNYAVGEFKPDITIVLDLPPEVALKRAKSRDNTNHFDHESLAFHKRVRQCFLTLSLYDPERCALLMLQEHLTPEQVHEGVWEVLHPALDHYRYFRPTQKGSE